MLVANVDELVDLLRPKLKQYLISKLGREADKKSFCCFAHKDSSPSMAYNPKNGETSVHCFSCNASFDIFSAAAYFDNLPTIGASWITETLPTLAKQFNIPVSLGELTALDRERTKQYRLAQDITSVLEAHPSLMARDYARSRNWHSSYIDTYSISHRLLVEKLEAMGWDRASIQNFAPEELIGDGKVTFIIRDYRRRVIGFTSRNIESKPKYINSANSLIYEKSKQFFGLDIALSEAKKHGIYVVEGPGDTASSYNKGIVNTVGCCGAALTADHMAQLKILGVKVMILCLDWDEAGINATKRILKEELRNSSGLSVYVVAKPSIEVKDLGELLSLENGKEIFDGLARVPAFEWLLQNSEGLNGMELCIQMIPSIASEQTAIRRDMLIRTLAQHTGISASAIREDVNAIRDSKQRERNDRVKTAAEKYLRNLEQDPDNAITLMKQHEDDLAIIEQEFSRKLTGTDYQLARYDAIQKEKFDNIDDIDMTEFICSKYKIFAAALSGNMPWTNGAYMLVGGRANSAKTAFCIAIATDILLNDPNALVCAHFTDDSYVQVEPRMKVNIAALLHSPGEPVLSIGMAANPQRHIHDEGLWTVYHRADNRLRELIASGKLTILDNDDGSTLSILDRNLRYIRNQNPNKKLFVICDGVHNYTDYIHLEQTARVTLLSTAQKAMTAAYKCCLMSTAEYRKNSPLNMNQIRWPTNDDLADARALMYRPNVIFHVYNDVNDRMENAEIFWRKPNATKMLPRLVVVVGKNKISSFKDKLVFDLDPDTVSLTEISKTQAKSEQENGPPAIQESTTIVEPVRDDIEDEDSEDVNDVIEGEW